ncbi:MAG: hypothetical protein KDB14_02570 [Planctomycetales bacterium]|nr:hypothetical protein [Planctomycetales bacterium]
MTGILLVTLGLMQMPLSYRQVERRLDGHTLPPQWQRIAGKRLVNIDPNKIPKIPERVIQVHGGLPLWNTSRAGLLVSGLPLSEEAGSWKVIVGEKEWQIPARALQGESMFGWLPVGNTSYFAAVYDGACGVVASDDSGKVLWAKSIVPYQIQRDSPFGGLSMHHVSFSLKNGELAILGVTLEKAYVAVLDAGTGKLKWRWESTAQ